MESYIIKNFSNKLLRLKISGDFEGYGLTGRALHEVEFCLTCLTPIYTRVSKI